MKSSNDWNRTAEDNRGKGEERERSERERGGSLHTEDENQYTLIPVFRTMTDHDEYGETTVMAHG